MRRISTYVLATLLFGGVSAAEKEGVPLPDTPESSGSNMAKVGAAYPNKVDLISRSDESVTLTLVQPEPIVGDMLLQLQDKLNNYIQYALDGQMVEQYPETDGLPVVIRVDLYAEQEAIVYDFLNRVAEVFAGEGVSVFWEVSSIEGV